METKNNKMAKQKSDGSSTFDRFNEVSKRVDTSNLSAGDIAALTEAGIDLEQLYPASGGGRPRKLNPELEIVIVKLIRANVAVSAIAKQFKISSQLVYNIAERHQGSTQYGDKTLTEQKENAA